MAYNMGFIHDPVIISPNKSNIVTPIELDAISVPFRDYWTGNTIWTTVALVTTIC